MRRRATVVLVRGKKVLLVKDRGKHHFSLPGGAIRKGEPTVAAAARELFEELGLPAEKVIRRRDCDFRSPYTEHKVCVIEATKQPHLRGHELKEFLWWDTKKPIKKYPHVGIIMQKLFS